MKIQMNVIVFTALLLGACIAGPTPHPAQDSGLDPNVAGQADALLGTPEDMVDSQETNPPDADTANYSDVSGDAVPEDGVTSDSVDGDITEEGDAVLEDVVPGDVTPMDAG